MSNVGPNFQILPNSAKLGGYFFASVGARDQVCPHVRSTEPNLTQIWPIRSTLANLGTTPGSTGPQPGGTRAAPHRSDVRGDSTVAQSHCEVRLVAPCRSGRLSYESKVRKTQFRTTPDLFFEMVSQASDVGDNGSHRHGTARRAAPKQHPNISDLFLRATKKNETGPQPLDWDESWHRRRGAPRFAIAALPRPQISTISGHPHA